VIKHDRAAESVAMALTHNDTKGGNDMQKKLLVAALVALIAAFCVAAGTAHSASAATQVSAAPATALHALDTCPPPFTVGYTCQFQPATVTTTSHTHSVVHSTVTKDVKTYQKITGHRVAIAVKPSGITAGCINPVSRGWITVGGQFQNSGSNTGYFWTYWKSGWTICGAHQVTINGHTYWKGKKGNCGNDILIPIGPQENHVTYIVDEFKTTTVFYSVYDKTVTKTSGTTYSCKAPFTLTYVNGKGVCFIATQIPVVTPPTTPTPGPTAVCYIGASPQYSWPSGYVAGIVGPNNQCIAVTQTNNCPSGTVKDSAGNCVNQSNAAQCQQTAQNLNATSWTYSGNTCTIVQLNIVTNCSNVTVIIGNGSPQVHQEGNCNTPPPPPPTPPAPPKPSVSVDFIEEMDASNGTLTSTRPMCALVSNAVAGNMVSITFRADYGSFSNPSTTVQIASDGTARGCAVYTAPTHGGVTDHVYAKPYNTSTSTNGDEASSNGFAVKTATANP
jgi:hypothetical protein